MGLENVQAGDILVLEYAQLRATLRKRGIVCPTRLRRVPREEELHGGSIVDNQLQYENVRLAICAYTDANDLEEELLQ